MNDTSDDIINLQRKLIYSKSVSERFEMAVEMYEMARQMALDSIKKENPAIHGKKLQAALFERFYRNDFSEEEMKKILAEFK